jgi:hypothetical protein
MRLCAHGGCGRIIPIGERRCPEHRQTEVARRDAKAKAYGYHSPHWQRTRRERLDLARYVCELRLPGCTERATHVHLDPAYRGQHYAAQLEHTRACCASCSGAIDAPRSHSR